MLLHYPLKFALDWLHGNNNSLDKNARDYYSHGANQEQTLKDNVEAFMR